jgi:hypothetical protein
MVLQPQKQSEKKKEEMNPEMMERTWARKMHAQLPMPMPMPAHWRWRASKQATNRAERQTIAVPAGHTHIEVAVNDLFPLLKTKRKRAGSARRRAPSYPQGAVRPCGGRAYVGRWNGTRGDRGTGPRRRDDGDARAVAWRDRRADRARSSRADAAGACRSWAGDCEVAAGVRSACGRVGGPCKVTQSE